MTIQEMITEVINDYVSSNGTSSIMDKDQLYDMVSEVYQINKNSFLPADFCYNRTNEGIDFEKHTHLFERLDDGRYLVLGEDYPYSGPVYYKRRGETEDSVHGIWTNGLYEEGAVVADVIELRFNDLFEGVKNILKTIPVTISADKVAVSPTIWLNLSFNITELLISAFVSVILLCTCISFVRSPLARVVMFSTTFFNGLTNTFAKNTMSSEKKIYITAVTIRILIIILLDELNTSSSSAVITRIKSFWAPI